MPMARTSFPQVEREAIDAASRFETRSSEAGMAALAEQRDIQPIFKQRQRRFDGHHAPQRRVRS